jgi:hypothetical protein
MTLAKTSSTLQIFSVAAASQEAWEGVWAVVAFVSTRMCYSICLAGQLVAVQATSRLAVEDLVVVIHLVDMAPEAGFNFKACDALRGE